MSLQPQFTRADIRSEIERKMTVYRNGIVIRFKEAGEQFVRLARLKTPEDGGYYDRTGNLRSSIGYMILYNGTVLFEAFPGSNPEGVAKGKALAGKESPDNGYVLVGVAGMEYAAAVESKGKDVITGSSQIVEDWLKNALQALKNKL